MFLYVPCRCNFALHYRMFYVDKGSLLKDDEFKFYTLIVAIATSILTLLLFKDQVYDLGTSFRYSVFQVLSLLTTTGYATVDFNQGQIQAGCFYL